MPRQSTAVNELVNLASGGRIQTQPGDEALFRMTRPAVAPPRRKPRGSTPPPPPALFTISGGLSYPRFVRPPTAPEPQAARKPSRNDRTSRTRVPRLSVVLGFVIVALGALVIAGDHYLGATVASAMSEPVAPPKPVVVAAPITVPPKPAPVAVLVPRATVRIASEPAGATVTLLDRSSGTAVGTLVGTTPIDASVDPTKHYELVLALAGKPTKIVALDPTTTPLVSVALDEPPAIDPAALDQAVRGVAWFESVLAATARVHPHVKHVASGKKPIGRSRHR